MLLFCLPAVERRYDRGWKVNKACNTLERDIEEETSWDFKSVLLRLVKDKLAPGRRQQKHTLGQ